MAGESVAQNGPRAKPLDTRPDVISRASRVPAGFSRTVSPSLLLAVLMAVRAVPVAANVAAPGIHIPTVVNCFRIANANRFPELLVLAVEHGSYRIVKPRDSILYESYGMEPTLYAIPRLEFREEEIGSGRTAVNDYFASNPRLIHLGTLDPVELRGRPLRTEQTLEIVELGYRSLCLEVTRARAVGGDGLAGGWQKPRRKHRMPGGRPSLDTRARWIRIEGMSDHPELTFVMRYADGHKPITPGCDIAYGRVYVGTAAEFSPDEIPEVKEEAWSYFAWTRRLQPIPLKLSIAPSERALSGVRIADVYEIARSASGRVELRPTRVVYSHSNGAVEEKPAAEVAYESKPRLLAGLADSMYLKPGKAPAPYVHLEGVDSFPDLLFLCGWPRTDRILGSQDTLPAGAVYAIPRRDFHPEQVKTMQQRRAYLQNAASLYLSIGALSSVVPNDGRIIRVVYVMRLRRSDNDVPLCAPLRAICTCVDGSVRTVDYPSVLTEAPTVTERRPITAGLPNLFSLVWFVLLPMLALAGIGFLLARRLSLDRRA